jgi:hypothetical protein
MIELLTEWTLHESKTWDSYSMELGGGVHILVKIVLLYTRLISRLVSFGGSAISKNCISRIRTYRF